jgi:lysophospholipase L1-like esterase
MKPCLRVVAALLTVIGVGGVPVTRAATLENLALNRPFTCTSPNQGGWDGLVDGARDSDRNPGCFATGGDTRFPKSVTIDIGSLCMVSRVDVLNSLNGNTKTVEISASTDGRQFASLRVYVFPNARLQTLTHKFPPRPVRFVRITFRDTYGGGYGGDDYMFLREVEVWGEPGAEEGGAANAGAPLEAVGTARWLRVFRRYAVQSRRPLTMIALGDSTVLPPRARPDIRAFSVLLARKLEEHNPGEANAARFTVQNIAAANQTASLALDRLDRDVIGRRPDVVLVCLGLADALNWNGGRFRFSLNEIIQRLVERTEAAVILIVPPPISHDPNVAQDRDATGCSSEEAADIVRAVGLLNNVPVVDTPAVFAASGRPASDLYMDSLHLSQEGQEAIAQAVLSVLQ